MKKLQPRTLSKENQQLIRKLSDLYEEVGQDFYEAFGNAYPHHQCSWDIEAKKFFIHAEPEDKYALGVSDTLGDKFSDNGIEFQIIIEDQNS